MLDRCSASSKYSRGELLQFKGCPRNIQERALVVARATFCKLPSMAVNQRGPDHKS